MDKSNLDKIFGCFDLPMRDSEFDQEAERLKLPTNSEVAGDSIADFIERAVLLPMETRLKLLAEAHINNAIFGWDAELIVEDSRESGVEYTEEEIGLLEQTFRGSGFALVRFADSLFVDPPVKRFCFMNLRAAKRIMDLNEEVFRGKIDGEPQAWLMQNIEKLMSTDAVTSGVLSGYAEASARQFDRLNQLEAKHHDLMTLMTQLRTQEISIAEMEQHIETLELQKADREFCLLAARYFDFCYHNRQQSEGNEPPKLFSEAEMDYWRQRTNYADKLATYYQKDIAALRTV